MHVPSTFDLRRLCRVTGATPFISLTSDCDSGRFGDCEKVFVKEIGSVKCTIFERKEEARVTTIVIRGSTQNILDDIDQALDDGICEFKVMQINKKFVGGAGSFETDMSNLIMNKASECSGLKQYPIRKFAEAFQIIPRLLAQNAGLDATEALSNIIAAHQKGENKGINLDSSIDLIDVKEQFIFDNLEAKRNAIKLATNVATTILLVDQIVMQKPAGGPKIPQNRMEGPLDAGDAAF